MEHLSNIEIFFSQEKIGNEVILRNDEFNHCVNVFRKKINDQIFITDGRGNLYKCEIKLIKKDFLSSQINENFAFLNTTDNLFICIPLLKNKDRFRFAIEKSVEMGITKFYFFKSERTLPVKFDELKIIKIMIETLKQSIRTYLPDFQFFYSFEEMIQKIDVQDNVFLFDLDAKNRFNKDLISDYKNNFFIFGPEGGFSKLEFEIISKDRVFNLSNSRLRSETAIIKLVSIIT